MTEPSPSCQVVLTRAGARAMLDRASGEVMHPIGGPLQESERLYVHASRLEARLRAPEPDPVVLFDIGLGAGSNAAAAIRLRQSLPGDLRRLSIISFERNLDALRLALEPQHATEFGWAGPTADIARALLRDGAYESPQLDWQLRDGDLLQALAREPADAADLTYWDPFSPGANPELWTLAAFRTLRRTCRPGASVHTYSGATAVRSALLLADFHVGIGEKIADGKHATVATLPPSQPPSPLDGRWLQRLTRSSAPFPPDSPSNALERIHAHRQFRSE